MKSRNYIPAVFSVFLLTGALMNPGHLEAATTYDFVGQVTNTSSSGVTNPFTTDTVLSGSFTFDETVSRSGGGSNFSNFDGAFSDFSVSISSPPSSPLSVISTSGRAQTASLGTDSLELLVQSGPETTADQVSGLIFSSFSLNFIDSSGSTFLNNPPELVSPDHILMAADGFSAAWYDTSALGYSVEISGSFSIASSVPEPASIGVFALSLTVLLRRRKR